MGGGWRKLAPFRFLQALVKLQSTMGFALGFYGCVAIDPTAVFERERPSKNRETRLPSQPQSLFGPIFSETSLPPTACHCRVRVCHCLDSKHLDLVHAFFLGVP